MDIKDFILIGGGLLIVAVIAHGFWIAWRGRRDALRLDIVPDLILNDVDDMERLRGELPNGGARVVTKMATLKQESLVLDPAPILLEPTVVDTDLQLTVSPRALVEPVVSETDDQPAVAGPVRSNVADVRIPSEPVVAEPPKRLRRLVARKEPEERAQAVAERSPVQEIIVMNVLARRGEHLTGDQVFAALRGKGLRFGDMNIFHRLDPETRTVRYSVANVVEPGTFEMVDMETFRSPGLCFFIQLPGPEEPGDAFDDMVSAARGVADELGAELKDERRSVMTPQTAEHYRQRITDFSRRRMSKRA